jgi:hypothetical protein
MQHNVIDNHQVGPSNQDGFSFAHKAVLIDKCDFLKFVLKQELTRHT